MAEPNVVEVNARRLKGYDWTSIAQQLGITRHQLWRWKTKTGYLDPLRKPTELELRTAIIAFMSTNNQIGEKHLLGHLLGEHHYAPNREHLRRIIRELYPGGRELRQHAVCKRRVYDAIRPKRIMHYDGYEKLVSWGIYITGAIDGYSRTITSLRASGNKRAGTVLKSAMEEHFLVHGIPELSRSDHGSENTGVNMFINMTRGAGRAIEGTSPSNQRIERLWRDVFFKVIWPYHTLFSEWTNAGMDMHGANAKFVLHHIFIPRINEDLAKFKVAWNNHTIRTVKKTPLQLLDDFPNDVLMHAMPVTNDIMRIYHQVMQHMQDNYDARGIREVTSALNGDAEVVRFTNAILPLTLVDTPDTFLARMHAGLVEINRIVRNRA